MKKTTFSAPPRLHQTNGLGGSHSQIRLKGKDLFSPNFSQHPLHPKYWKAQQASNKCIQDICVLYCSVKENIQRKKKLNILTTIFTQHSELFFFASSNVPSTGSIMVVLQWRLIFNLVFCFIFFQKNAAMIKSCFYFYLI